MRNMAFLLSLNSAGAIAAHVGCPTTDGWRGDVVEYIAHYDRRFLD